MAHPSSKLSIFIGILVSLGLGWQLTFLIMTSGVTDRESFTDFISQPTSLLYVALRVLLCFTYWFMRGPNNRTYIICWVVGDLLSSYIFVFGLSWFYYDVKNIYALNFLSFVSVVPLFLFCRYRLYILVLIFNLLRHFNRISDWCTEKLQRLSITKSITRLDWWLKCLVFIELSIALSLTVFAVVFKLTPTDSIEVFLINNNFPDLFSLQMFLVNTWTFVFIILLIRALLDDRKRPDGFIEVSDSVRNSVLKKFKEKK